MGCDSIATTISGMGKEPTTLGPEDLKGHRFSAIWLSQACLSGLFPPEFIPNNVIKRSRRIYY